MQNPNSPLHHQQSTVATEDNNIQHYFHKQVLRAKAICSPTRSLKMFGVMIQLILKHGIHDNKDFIKNHKHETAY
jgi:hypothetical protein